MSKQSPPKKLNPKPAKPPNYFKAGRDTQESISSNSLTFSFFSPSALSQGTSCDLTEVSSYPLAAKALLIWQGNVELPPLI